MAYVFFNPNPDGIETDDCTVRAISLLLDRDWDSVYFGIVIQGAIMHKMPSTNCVWIEYLKRMGYVLRNIPNTCPACYTIAQFCRDNPVGRYLLGTGSHVVCVVDGNYYDTWDSGSQVPIFYMRREED